MHCSDTELHSGLCREHFNAAANACQICSAQAGAESCDETFSWHPCSSDSCKREVHLCSACFRRSTERRLLCTPCWTDAGRKCIKCGSRDAQTALRYMYCCVKCFSEQDVAELAKLVQDESLAFRESVRQHPALRNIFCSSTYTSVHFVHLGSRI